MDVCGGDDEKVQFWEIGKRVDFVAFADAESTATEEKERDVGSEAGGEIEEAGQVDFGIGEAETAEKRSSGPGPFSDVVPNRSK